MDLLFLGTPAFAVPSLEALAASGHRVVLAITRPERARGRGLAPASSAVHAAARRLGIPVLAPPTVKEPAFAESVRGKADLLAVVSYGEILPDGLLAAAPRGAVNLHPSLLPRWRGASPIPWTILAGDETAGVTVMAITSRMDAGPILLQRGLPLGADETAASLSARLAEEGARLLVEAVDSLAAGTLRPAPQDESKATYTCKIRKEDGDLRFDEDAGTLARRVRALQPWPGARGVLERAEGGPEELQILAARAEPGEGPPGRVLATGPSGVAVACGRGALRILRVKPASGREMEALAFVNGHRIRPGDRFRLPVLEIREAPRAAGDEG